MSFENTNNYHLYQHYKQIKNSLAYNYKGIDLSKVIAWNLLGIVVYGYKAKLKDFIYYPFLRIDTLKLNKSFQLHDTLFTTFFEGRKDYLELLSKISASIDNPAIVPINPHRKSLRINLSETIRLIRFIYGNRQLDGLGLMLKLYLIFMLVYYCHAIDDMKYTFRKANLTNKKYIPFNSAVGIEALLTLFFKSKGVKTFHIFHGIFGRYKIKIANDIINGENINAEYILAYSESTKEDLIRDFGHLPDKIFIAGNPKFPSKEISVNTQFKKCIVLNGFSFYDMEFLTLLTLLNEVALETGITFEVKPHPTSKILLYPEIKNLEHINFIPRGKTIKELFKTEKYDFAITFNTVTYYECMYYNLICLRYSVGENLNFDGLDDRFVNGESLLGRIAYFKNHGQSRLNHDIKQLLIRTLGAGVNNYSNIVNNI